MKEETLVGLFGLVCCALFAAFCFWLTGGL